MLPHTRTPRRGLGFILAAAAVVVPVALVVWLGASTGDPPGEPQQAAAAPKTSAYKPRYPIDSSGFTSVSSYLKPWPVDATLDRVSSSWRGAGYQLARQMDVQLREATRATRIQMLLMKASFLNFEGETEQSSAVLTEARIIAEGDPALAHELLYTVIAFQGITALRQGETDNCVMCRGETSCILPLAPAAIHTRPEGSRLAIAHFTKYLEEFPADEEIRWLLNFAHMTLGEYPEKVDPRYLVTLDRYNSAEHGIGRFRDVGDRVGINRLNQAGGAILDDFDNDGWLDIVFTSMDPSSSMVYYRNRGTGTFEDRTRDAKLADQLGGLNCVQADYNNDGFLDIFIPRGAWLLTPVRSSLLRNNGNGTFTDVTAAAGLLEPANSIAASWADYDNDGWLDLFVCCEKQPNRLYRNRGDGTFENVAARAGVDAPGGTWKGAAWIDYDADRFPDLFLNNLNGTARLFHNNGNGTFAETTAKMGIDGPSSGFSCWACDYDNDGWPDLFATSYDRTLPAVINGLQGKPHNCQSSRLYRNLGGTAFRDVAKESGLDLVFGTMGSNFGDFDNDGYLDFYLGTGDPQLSMLIPNRMLRNLGGKQFADISGSSGTGHLQKGHGVACGDWRRTGLTDIVIEMGGAMNGDRYHNVLFENPGSGNHWLNVKLAGKKSNRSALGARIKVVTAGKQPQTVYRWVSSGSSFGANPLEQSIGLGPAERIALLEVYWPTSNTTQSFRDLGVDQFIEVTEFEKDYRRREFKPIAVPR